MHPRWSCEAASPYPEARWPLALCVVLASGLNYEIGQWLSGADEATESAEPESEETTEKKSPARAKTSRKPDKRSYLDPILRRNIFDPDASPAEAAEDTPDSDRATDLDLVLLATIVAVPESYSSALIAEGKRGGEAGGYGIGDTLLNEAEIIGIEQKRILLRRSNNEVEYLAIEEGTTRRSSRKSDERRATAACVRTARTSGLSTESSWMSSSPTSTNWPLSSGSEPTRVRTARSMATDSAASDVAPL